MSRLSSGNLQWKLSLQSACTMFTLCCLFCGWVAWGLKDLRRQQACVRYLEERGYRLQCIPFESQNGLSPLAWLSLIEPRFSMQVVRASFANGVPAAGDLRALANFPELFQLDVRKSHITAECILAISQLSSLQSLDMSGSLLPDGATLQRLEQLTSLLSLNLSGTDLSDDDLRCLQGCRALASLNLMGCPITDGGTASLISLASLRRLDVSHTGIGDESMLLLAALHGLSYLDVCQTEVSEEALTYLQLQLPQLMVTTQRLFPPPAGVAAVTPADVDAASPSTGQLPVNAG